MSDALEKRNRLEGQFRNNYPLEDSSQIVDAADHQCSDEEIGFEVLHGHLLVEGFELGLDGSDLLLVAFVLGLNDMVVLFLLHFLV